MASTHLLHLYFLVRHLLQPVLGQEEVLEEFGKRVVRVLRRVVHAVPERHGVREGRRGADRRPADVLVAQEPLPPRKTRLKKTLVHERG